MSRVIVIGAGPGGLMAAAQAALNGNDVTILEKNSKVGRKLYISGKGRCNITNDCDLDTLIKNTPGNGSFLYSSFSRFSARDIIDFFDDIGVKTKVERGNRVFPVSDKAADVVDALYKYVQKCGARLLLNAEAVSIDTHSEPKTVVYKLNNNKIKAECENVIISTGGVSYPLTGSTGDGIRFSEEMGHTVIPLKPSLIPFITAEKWIKGLQGLSLKNVSVKLIRNKTTKLFEDFGEMLFTHYGVSGPLILSASSHIRDFDYNGLELIIDLKPALTTEQIDNRLQKDFAKYIKKNFINALDDLLPKSLIPVIVELSAIEEGRPVNQITKDERQRLANLLKNLTVTPVSPRPIEEAIITAGGVSVKEVNPRTMESKIVPGVYFVGEILDVDAYTGGFNLTIAFSTGYTAGNNIY